METATARKPQASPHRFEAEIARRWDLVTRAQRLRSRSLPSGAPFEEDRFDEHCEHLVVRDVVFDEVVAACRVLSPRDALRSGGNIAATDFDLALLIVLRDRMVEIDRPCVDPRYRGAPVLGHLLSGLARYLIENRFDYVFGTVEMNALDGGHVAASTYREACFRSLSPEDYRVFPRRRLAVEQLSATRPVKSSDVLNGFLDRGAWICGEPALDSWNGRAVFPLLTPLARMHVRDAKQFLAKAS